MNRSALAHILRAAANVAGDGDIAFFDDAFNTKSDMVDGAIGEDSLFHQTFGYYGQGVSISTATLPAGWEDRLVDFVPADSEPAEGVCLEPVDLVVAKLVAGREKDLSFAADLISSGHVSSVQLRERVQLLRVIGAVQRRVLDSIDRLER